MSAACGTREMAAILGVTDLSPLVSRRMWIQFFRFPAVASMVWCTDTVVLHSAVLNEALRATPQVHKAN